MNYILVRVVVPIRNIRRFVYNNNTPVNLLKKNLETHYFGIYQENQIHQENPDDTQKLYHFPNSHESPDVIPNKNHRHLKITVERMKLEKMKQTLNYRLHENTYQPDTNTDTILNTLTYHTKLYRCCW